MDALTGDPQRRGELLERTKREALAHRERGAATRAARRAIARLGGEVASPPTFRRRRSGASRTLDRADIDLRELWPCFDLRSLYRLSWGGANTKGDRVRTARRRRVRAAAAALSRAEAMRGDLLQPARRLRLLSGSGLRQRRDRSTTRPIRAARSRGCAFPRQVGGEHLESRRLSARAARRRGERRRRAADRYGRQRSDAAHRALQAAGDYSESYFLHGFSVQAAEALAELTHRRIRTRAGLERARGKRYSWGYGACPDLEQHAIAFRLLDATRAIGVDADGGVPDRARAIDRGDRHAPPARGVFQRRGDARARSLVTRACFRGD